MILATRLLTKESRTLLFSRVTRKKLLERVACADLHHAGVALDLGEVGPVCRRVKAAAGGISRYTEASSARVNEAEGLQVRDIEHIPAHLELMFFAPRHVPRFRQSEVHVHVSGQANVIPRPGFTGI